MPYICLARDDIPDGTVQVLDLQPNVSQRNLVYDPPGQTRYLRRPTVDTARVNANGTLGKDVRGIAAYIVDRVEVDPTSQASATVTCLGVLAGDTVVIKGVAFTAVNGGATAASQEFDMSGSNDATAASLAATVTDAASITLMKASGSPTDGYAGASDAANVVTLTALTGAGAPLLGAEGQFSVTTSSSVRLALNTTLNRLFRPTETWSAAALTTTIDALFARVDGGLSLTLADINTALDAGSSGSELTGASTGSTGTVAEVLSIMAGRQYLLPHKHPLTGVATQVAAWTAGQGGFTSPVLVHGSTMQSGEIRPAAIGGDVENRDVGPYRATYDGGSLQRSLSTGHLAVLAGVAGLTPVTLFPNNSPTPLFPWDFQGAVPNPPVTVSRVVTVYDDDGAVLA